MTAKSITTFPVLDRDDCIEIRDLGVFEFRGIKMTVEIEAFSESEEGLIENDYDFGTADLHLQPVEGEFSSELIHDTDLETALQTFMVATLEGESDVSWGESGAQSKDLLAFGRNGW